MQGQTLHPDHKHLPQWQYRLNENARNRWKATGKLDVMWEGHLLSTETWLTSRIQIPKLDKHVYSPLNPNGFIDRRQYIQIEDRVVQQDILPTSNQETIEAMQELENGGGSKVFENSKEMFADLGV